jgi:hypothetical protein
MTATTVDVEEEEQCKFCWETTHIKNMVAPCACTGTMKFVHPNCLTLWLFQKDGSNQCEVCKTVIHFSLPLHHDITIALACTWMYIIFIVFVPYFYTYFTSVGGLEIKA